MSTVQAVFLVDVNAFKISPFHWKESLQVALLNVRLICLRLLSEFSSRSGNVRWGFKFFNSDGNLSQKMEHISFSDVNLDSYETFEHEIGIHFERHIAYSKTLVAPGTFKSDRTQCRRNGDSSLQSAFSSFCPVKILHLAITQILCEYLWDPAEIHSPAKRYCKKQRTAQRDDHLKNYMFLVSRCPTDFEDFVNFFGKRCDTSFTQEVIIPPAQHEKIVSCHIRLIWLDTSNICSVNKIVSEENEKIHQTVHKFLSKLSGALVPMEALFCSVPQEDPFNGAPVSKEDDILNIVRQQKLISPDALLPFSSLCKYYLTDSSQYNSDSNDNSSLLIFGSTTISIKVMPTSNISIRTQSDADTATHQPCASGMKRKLSLKKTNPIQSHKKNWHRFIVQNTIVNNSCLCPESSSYVCWPTVEKSSKQQNANVFRGLLRLVSRKKISLVVTCEAHDGSTAFGVLSYLSLVSATIVVFDSSVSLVEKNYSLRANDSNKKINPMLDKFLLEKSDFICHEKEFTMDDMSAVKSSNDIESKLFSMHSVERWFVPNIGKKAVLQQFSQTSSSKQNLLKNDFSSLYKPKLSTSQIVKPPIRSSSDTVLTTIRKSPRLRRSHSSVLNISERSASLVERSFHMRKNSSDSVSSAQSSEACHPVLKRQKATIGASFPSPSFTNEKDMLDHLNGVYNSALESDVSLISCAQALMNVIMCFVQSKNVENSQVELEKILKSNFFLPIPKINSKYDGCSDSSPEMKKKIKEYKMQVVLALELESLLQRTSSEECIEKVTGILRKMSFIAGPSDLNQFLYNTLKPNYNHTLHAVLVEIGDELNVPFVSEILSPSSVTDTTSSFDGPGSMLSYGSALSMASSSSIATNRSNSQPIQRNTSFLRGTVPSGNFQRRQILVPKSMLKNKSSKATQLDHPVRHSPRLAAKRAVRTPTKVTHNMKNVCRNLFDTEKSACNLEEKSVVCLQQRSEEKRKSSARKSRRVLKTDYVSATPRQKQGIFLNKKLKLLRAKCGTISTAEVPESPVTMHTRKGSRKSSVHCKFPKSCFFYADKSFDLAERLKVQENAVKDASNSVVVSIVSPPRLLPEILSSPSLKHPTRSCSRKLFDCKSLGLCVYSA